MTGAPPDPAEPATLRGHTPALAWHGWVDAAREDAAFALRHFRRTPGITLLIVLTLAIGIGANVTMTAAIDSLMLRPPALIRDPGSVVRLVTVTQDTTGKSRSGAWANYPMLLDLQRSAPAFGQVAALAQSRLSSGTGALARPISATTVSASYFDLLGAAPELGRTFGARDGFPSGSDTGGPALALLSDRYWRAQYGADRAVIGTQITVGTARYTVTGVMPPGFTGAEDAAPDVWIPMSVAVPASSDGISLDQRGGTWLTVIGRLRPSATAAEAGHQASEAWLPAMRALGASPTDRISVVAAPLQKARGPDATRDVRMTKWLAFVSVLVLFMACVNVTSLLLARAFQRRPEIALRLAIGATPSRIARQLLAEALLLALVAGAAGVGVAIGGGWMLRRLGVVHDAGASIGSILDARLLVIATGVALVTAVLISLVPIRQALHGDLVTSLRRDAASLGGRTSRTRSVLVAMQSALCLVMLATAGMFLHSLRRVHSIDLGVDVEHTVSLHVDLTTLAIPYWQVDSTYAEIERRLRAVPGVARVTLAMNDPHESGRAVSIYRIVNGVRRDYRQPPRDVVPMESAVDSGYFTTTRATLRGRDFSSTDTPASQRVVILNAAMTRLLFDKGEDPIGECVYLPARSDAKGESCYRVIGVVDGFWRSDILQRDALSVFVPLTQQVVKYDLGRPHDVYLSVRGDPERVAEAARRAAQSVRPDLPLVRATTMASQVDPQVQPWRVSAVLFSAFGAVALLIAVVGLYGVVSFTTTQRAPELALRQVLGARARDLFVLVVGNGMSAMLGGLIAGLIVLAGMRSALAPLLYETSATDPMLLAGATGALVATALIAAVVPLSRVLRSEPARVLRAE